MSSIEAYSSSGWQPINAPLPEGVHFSCSVTLNATAVLLIGGQSDSQVNFTHFNNINSYFSFQIKIFFKHSLPYFKTWYECKDSLFLVNQLLANHYSYISKM